MKKIFILCTLCIEICTLSTCGFDKTDIPGMVWIEPGTFWMGSPDSEPDRSVDPVEKKHKVTLSGFYISRYVITQEQYFSVMADMPAHFADRRRSPADGVTWYEAIIFCNKLSIREGLIPVYKISGSTNPSDWEAIPKPIYIVNSFFYLFGSILYIPPK